MDTMTNLKGETGRDARRRIRTGGYRVPTSRAAPGYVQGNLAILPKALAADFARFCHLNPKPCPLLAASEPGDWRLPTLGEDLDIRTDIPLYRVWREYRDLPWPLLLSFWGVPNLQVINREIHAAKCATEARDRGPSNSNRCSDIMPAP